MNNQKIIVSGRRRQASPGIFDFRTVEARCPHTWHGCLAKVALHAIFQVNVGLCNRGRRRCLRSFTSRTKDECARFEPSGKLPPSIEEDRVDTTSPRVRLAS